MKRLLYILVFSLVFFSCQTERKLLEFNAFTFENNYNANISCIIDKARGNDEISKKINAQIEETILQELALENAENLKTALESFNSEYLKFKKDFEDESEIVWELNIETELIYNTENIISIAVSIYEFRGGAHGNDKIKLLNLNSETGEIFLINSIINDMDGFKKIAESHFIKNLKNNNESQSMEDYFFGEPFELPENFGFSEDGLILLYNVYEIATYAQGYTEFVIPFEELENYLKVAI